MKQFKILLLAGTIVMPMGVAAMAGQCAALETGLTVATSAVEAKLCRGVTGQER